MTSPPNYLDPATLASISSLELRARMIVEGVMSGMHRSPYQGFSLEFAQHRQYSPGDDIRHLDWKVFARTDKLYLKQHQQETNLDLIVLVDVSGSMAYGSSRQPAWRKYDHAASIAAALTYLALQQQDRVGLVLFADRVRTATRMSNSREHGRSIIELLSAQELAPGPADVPGDGGQATDLARLFDQVLAKVSQRSLLVLISDLFDAPEALEQGLARLQHRRHDLMVLQTLDPAELDFPFREPSEFAGLEGEGRIPLDPAALRQAYLDALHRHQEAIEQVTRRFRFDYLMLNTSEPLAAPLSLFLARRAAMIARGKA